MGRKKGGSGGRRRGRKRGSSPASGQGNGDAAHNRTVADGVSGSSRIRLTRLLRDGALWDVFIATTARAGSPNIVRLEFERSGAGRDRVRYARPVCGQLLEALHGGASLSRADLDEELERAIRQADAVADEPPESA